jgi:hypothetical protein
MLIGVSVGRRVRVGEGVHVGIGLFVGEDVRLGSRFWLVAVESGLANVKVGVVKGVAVAVAVAVNVLVGAKSVCASVVELGSEKGLVGIGVAVDER